MNDTIQLNLASLLIHFQIQSSPNGVVRHFIT